MSLWKKWIRRIKKCLCLRDLGSLSNAPVIFSTNCPACSLNSYFLCMILEAHLSMPFFSKKFLILNHKLIGHTFYFSFSITFLIFFFTFIYFFYFDMRFSILLYDVKSSFPIYVMDELMLLLNFTRYVIDELMSLLNFTQSFINIFMIFIYP